MLVPATRIAAPAPRKLALTSQRNSPVLIVPARGEQRHPPPTTVGTTQAEHVRRAALSWAFSSQSKTRAVQAVRAALQAASSRSSTTLSRLAAVTLQNHMKTAERAVAHERAQRRSALEAGCTTLSLTAQLLGRHIVMTNSNFHWHRTAKSEPARWNLWQRVHAGRGPERELNSIKAKADIKPNVFFAKKFIEQLIG